MNHSRKWVSFYFSSVFRNVNGIIDIEGIKKGYEYIHSLFLVFD
jgi:hypothetical protein